MRFRSLSSAAVLLSAGLFLSNAASASIISIGISQAGVNGGALTTVATDSTTPGSASYSGNYGPFVFNSITATGSPILAQGNLSTTSIQASTSASPGGLITVFITEQGLTSPTGLTSFLTGFTSNLFSGSAISVVESSFFSNTNQLYGGTQLATHTFNGLDTSSSTNLATLAGPYSETVEYAITSSAGVASVNDTVTLTATAVTPEPSSLVLLGTGLIGTATTLLRRRRNLVA